MIQAAEELGKKTGISSACQALGVPRSSVCIAPGDPNQPRNRGQPQNVP